MPTKEQFEYARAQLEYHAQKGHIDKYTILPNASTGRIEVMMSFSFDPKERCLQVFRLTPPKGEVSE